MRKMAHVRLGLLLALVITAVSLTGGHSASAQSEEPWIIDSFDIVYDVRSDGTIEGKETIRVDFGGLQKHGIFRDFYTRVSCAEPIAGAQQPIHECPGGSFRQYDYEIHDVTRLDGSGWKYEVSDNQGATRVKIGDGDVIVSGKQDYVITYTLSGALDEYDDHAEFYWDATGLEWVVGFTAVSINVNLPEGADTNAACYQGFEGSNEKCETAAEGSTIRYTATRPLSFGEGVTIVAGWQNGLVEIPPPVIEDEASFSDFFTLDFIEFAGLIGSAVVGVLLVAASWHRFGRDKAYLTIHYLTNETAEGSKPIRGGPPVVVEFLPPEDLRPAQMGVLLDERADMLDVTATIVDLAVRGYLHITELPKAGWFGSNDWKLTKKQEAAELNAFEQKVFVGLFSTGDEVELSDLKYKFAQALSKSQKLIYDDAMKHKWFSVRPETSKGMWAIVAVALIILGVGLSCFSAVFWSRGLFFLGLIPAGIVMLVVSRSMAHRTAAGSEMLRRVLGFRMYIETAEKHRQEFNEKENIFARYLPFAIVFGCVSKWAKAFEGLESTAAASTTSWYSGTHAFAPVAFASSLHSFSNSVGSTLGAGASSSGSGGSGFSGGSSGGGGGGGGGGSW